MKTMHEFHAMAAVALFVAQTALSQTPVGTSFTFQGTLSQAGVPLDGPDAADLRFHLYSASSGGTLIAGPVTVPGVDFDAGRFTVVIDFGGTAFGREARWLQIAVSAPPGSGFLILLPRHRITPTPVAQVAGEVQGEAIYGPPVNGSSRGPFGAAVFDIDNLTNSAAAVYASTNGTGYGIRALAPPAGYAGYFEGRAYVSGNVGLGTSAPITKLHLNVTGLDGLLITGNNTGAAFVEISNGGGPHFMFDDHDAGHALTIESAIGRDTVFNTGGNIERMRINSAGNVGIGTVNPSQKLHVANPSTAVGASAVLGVMTATFNGDQSAGVRGINAGTGFDCIDLPSSRYGVWGTANDSGGGGNCGVAGVYGSVTGAGGTGVKGVGHIGVYGSSSSGNGYAGYFWNGSVFINERLAVGVTTLPPVYKVELSNVATNAGGRVRANRYDDYSSIRWKHDVAPIEDALARLVQLRGVTFEWNVENGGTRDIGFVAEEVGQIFPELVSWEPDGQWALGLAYGRLTAVAVEAIKQQQSQIRSQQERMETLEAESAALRGRLARLETLLSALPSTVRAEAR